MITLKTLPKATEQQVFDQVAEHLLKQGEKSENAEEEYCSYRKGNLMCAAGCLIGDEEYLPSMENMTWMGLVSMDIAPKKHARLISQLQLIHDTKEVKDWKSQLKRLAREWKLNWTFEEKKYDNA